MAFSVSPSVIVREVDASAAVPAIATSPAAIAGVFRWGPVGETVLISSENELVDRFGQPNDNNYETFFTAADYLSYANALWVARVDNGAVKADATDIVLYDANTAPSNTQIGDIDPDNSTYGAFEALYPGELGNSIDVSYVTSDAFAGDMLDVGDIPATYVAGANSQILATANEIEFAATQFLFQIEAFDGATENDQMDAISAGDKLVIGNDSVGYQKIEVSSIAERVLASNGTPLTGPDAANSAIAAAKEYTVALESPYILTETDLNKLSLAREWGLAGDFGSAPQAGNVHIAVIDRGGVVSGTAGSLLELYTDISTTVGATRPDGRTNYYVNVIENESSWVAVANTTQFEAQTEGLETLAGGTDGTNEAATSLAAYAGGYELFNNPNEIDVSFVLQGKGDDAGTRANYIIGNIVDNRKDAIAFISPSKEASVDENKVNAKLAKTIAYRNKLQNSSYWFMDSGYKYRYDKYNDVYRWVPLNGDMAGLASRVEPFESPAGFRKGVIKNVVKLAFNPNKAQRDQLYSADINPVMSQVGQGIVLFGDKTGLGQTSAFDRINVRRLFISVEKAIANAAQSFLFELNDEFSQTQFRNIVEPFLREIQGRRGIIDFRVISDSTVNTPAIIDQGKFRANIFIKPARSINVIELTFVATRTGIEFEEIVGSI